MAIVITNDFGRFDVKRFDHEEDGVQYWRSRPFRLASVLFLRNAQCYEASRRYGTHRAVRQIVKYYKDQIAQEEKDPRRSWLLRSKKEQMQTVENTLLHHDARHSVAILLRETEDGYFSYESRRFETVAAALEWGKKTHDVGACYLEEDDEAVVVRLQPVTVWGDPRLLAQLKVQVEANELAKRALRSGALLEEDGSSLKLSSSKINLYTTTDLTQVAKALTAGDLSGLDDMSVLALLQDEHEEKRSHHHTVLRTLASTYDESDDEVTEEKRIETKSPLLTTQNSVIEENDGPEDDPLVLCINVKGVTSIPETWPEEHGRFCAATLVSSSTNSVWYRSGEYSGHTLDFGDGFVVAFIIPSGQHEEPFKLMVSMHDAKLHKAHKNYVSSMVAYVAVSASKIDNLFEEKVLNLADTQSNLATGAAVRLSALTLSLTQAKRYLLNTKTDAIVMVQQRQASCCLFYNFGTTTHTAWQQAGLYKPQDASRPFELSASMSVQDDTTFEALCPLPQDAKILKPWHTTATEHTDTQGWQYGRRLEDHDWFSEPTSAHAFRRACWIRLSVKLTKRSRDSKDNSGLPNTLIELRSAKPLPSSLNGGNVQSADKMPAFIDIQTLHTTYGYPLTDQSRILLERAWGDATAAVSLRLLGRATGGSGISSIGSTLEL